MEGQGLQEDVLVGIYMDRQRYLFIAFGYLQDMEKAKDIFSDSFAYILEHKDELKGDLVQMNAYFLQVIKHKCMDVIKHDTVAQKVYTNLYKKSIDDLTDDNITRNIVRNDIYEIVRRSGQKMDRVTFEIYVDRKFHGLSHKELSRMYGISQSRVAKEIYKAGKIVEKFVRDYLHAIILLIGVFLTGSLRF